MAKNKKKHTLGTYGLGNESSWERIVLLPLIYMNAAFVFVYIIHSFKILKFLVELVHINWNN